jgi:hypothetical protein
MKKLKRGDPVTFFIIFFTAVGFAIAGLLFPPPGQIDNSLLILIAQFLVLAAGVYGFSFTVDIQKGRVEAGKEKPQEEEIINN